ncbi:MAG: VUT family protein [Pseudomonadota bacterium]
MEAAAATENHQRRETALQRLQRQTGEFFFAFGRMVFLAGVLTVILLLSFLTIDIPLRAFDGFFGNAVALRPSNWLTRGAYLMGTAPLVAILIARKFGGDEANRAVTAAWGFAAFAVFAELSYLAPVLEEGDLPSVRFAVATVASAMMGQFMAVSIYDVARGGGAWWRAPLFGAIGAYLSQGLIYFPTVYWGSPAPWLNWMVTDFALHMLMAGAFLPVYGALRRRLRPVRGYGGR